MMNNYNSFGNRSGTKLKTREPALLGTRTQNSRWRYWCASLMLMISFLVSHVGFSQQIVTLGSGGASSTASTTSAGLGPVNQYYAYQRFQVVYTASELLAAGAPIGGGYITEFGWNVATPPNGNLNNYKVRMANTSDVNTSSYVSTPLTEVYNTNSKSFVSGYNMLVLSGQGFYWDGTSNLLVDICTGSNSFTSAYGNVYVYGTETNSSRFIRDDSSDKCTVSMDTSFYVNSWKPQARFSFISSDECNSPIALQVSNVSTNGASFSWSANTIGLTPDGYDYAITLSSAEPTTWSSTSSNIVSNVTGLLSSSQYYLHVRSQCADDNHSVWNSKSFYTLCEIPIAPSALSFGPVSNTGTTVSFTSPTQTPFGYVIFRSASATPPVLTNGTIYSVSQSAVVTSLTSGGNTYYCVYNGANPTGAASSLTSNTNYYYHVFSRNGVTTSECASGPLYSVTALSGSQITAPATPGTVTAVPSFTTANLSWVASAVGGDASVISYVVEVYTSNAYTTHVGGSPYSAGSLSAVISGLNQGTTYYYRVKAVNGADSSYVTGSFSTLMMGQIGSGVSTNANLPLNTNYGYNYSQQIYTKAQFEAVINPGEKYINKIRFYYHGTSTTGGESNVSANFNAWKVYLGNTAKASFASATDWIPLAELQEVYSGIIPSTLTPGWVEFVLPASFEWDQTSNLVVAVSEEVPSFGTTSYWRSFSSATNTGMYYRVDTAPTGFLPSAPPAGTRTNTLSQVQFDLSTVAMSCLMPSTLVVNNVSDNSATLTWNAPATGTPTGYEYAVTTSATAPSSGTPISGTSVTDYGSLLSNTVYYLHVRSACSGVEYSSWKTISFTTLCTTVATLSENFDTTTVGNFLPNCWLRFVNGSGSQSISTTTPLNGVRHLYLYSSGAANSSLAVLPNFNNVTTGTHRLRLKARVGSGTGVLQVGYVTNISSAAASTASFVSLQTLNITNTTYVALNAEYIVNFAGSIPAGARVAIFNPGTSVVGHYIDDVVWEEMPNCQVVDGLINASLTQNSSTFSWNAPTFGATPEDYEYAFTTSATPPTSGTLLTGGALIANANSLTADTAYYFHIRSVCGVNTYSEWVTRSFYTGYCVPTGNNTSYQITNITTTGATTNMTSVSSGGAGYVDYSASRSVSHYAGGNFGISITTNSTTSTFYHYVWVDWNDNLSFTDANEAVIATSSYVNLYNGTIVIPAGTPLGSYKMRVAISFSGAITACGATSGEYEDYTLTVVAPPVCMMPTTPTASNITIGSAVLSWTSTASLFDIKYGAPGFNVATEGTLQTAVSNSYLLPGLAHSTAYQYYVRTNCDVDGVSDWAGPFSFTTAIPGQIGTGTATSSNFPILSNYVYNYSQQIYLSSELHAVLEPGSTYITKIRFKQVSLGTQSTYNNWTVYMANTAKTTFATASDWMPYSSLDQVFSGVLTFATNSWVEITLDTPFIWDGVSNLIVAVDENTAGYSSSSFAAFNSGTDRGILYYSDSINPDPVSPPTSGDYFIKSTTIAQAQFVATALPTCFAPRTLAINLIGATSATLSWNAPLMGTTAGYEYVLSTSATVPTGPGTAVSGTSVNVSDLTGGATYYLHVRNVCEAGVEYSTWSTSPAATMPLVTAVPWFEGFATALLPVQWSQIDMQVGNFTGMGGNPGIAIAGNLYYDYDYYEGIEQLTLTTPNLGVIVSGQKFSFDYKLANYYSPYGSPAIGSGNIVVEVSTNFGATYTTIETIPNNAVAGWQYKEYDLTSYAGGYVKFRIISNYNSGDYNVGFDNFRIAMPCTGIPNGGSIAPAVQSICAGYPSATLVVTGFSNEPGVSLQWQTNTGSGWTDIVGITTASYLPANYAGGVIQYRVKVTCATSGEISYSSVSEINDNPQPLPFATDFSEISSLTGWSQNGWFIGAARGAIGNTGDNAYAALTTTTAANLTTGNLGVVQASHAISFDYQVTNNANPYAASAANAATITVSVSANCGASYNVLETFSNDATAGYKHRVVSLGAYAGQNVLVRITAQRQGTTSVDVSIDNVIIDTPPASIATFTPNAVCGRGDEVTITGNYFENVTSVLLGDTPISYTVTSLNTITFEVPNAMVAGNYAVTITTAKGTAVSSSVLSVKDYPMVDPITGPSNQVCGGGNLTLTNLTGGGDWSSSNPALATVSGGIVTGVAQGSAVIYYTIVNDDCSTTVEYPITINAPVVVTSYTTIQNAVVGESATFTVTATGDDLTYQWYLFDGSDSYLLDDEFSLIGENYSGTTTASMTISNAPIDFNDIRFYYVVSGAASCSSVMPADVDLYSVLYVGNTGIGQDPQSVTLCDGGSATFTVVRSGDDAPEDITYMWEYNIDNTNNWLLVEESIAGMYLSGFTTDVLTVSGITTAHEGYRFRATINGPANFATSTPALLTVTASVGVSSVDGKEVCYSGGVVTFAADTTGDVQGLQWQYSADGLTWDSVSSATPAGVSYSGATTNVLTITTTGTTPIGAYYYRIAVSGSGACTTVYSNGATMEVNAPVLSSVPSAQTVLGGQVATFAVGTPASGATYQWQYSNSINGMYNNVVNATPANITYSGNTTSTLNVTTTGTIAVGSNHFYRVVVTVNGCSIASPGAQLNVLNYCVGGTTNPNSSTDVITNVVLTNTSTALSYTNSTGTTSGSSGHFVFNNAPVVFTQGHIGQVAITFGTEATQHSAVWIDFNGNQIFETSENVALSAVATGASGTVTYSFTIPFTATVGLTKIRIRGAANVAYTAAGACTTAVQGQTEDYWIQILEAPLCNDAMVAGVITSSGNSLCLLGSVVLTATGYSQGFQGLSMQWYNSQGAISSATSATYTTPVLTDSETYFLRISCSESGLYTDSVPFTVIVNNPLIATTTDATRCGLGTVSLSATSENTGVRWYSASTGGTMLGTGATFVTPDISTTTTYYAAAYQSSTTETVVRIGTGTGTSSSAGASPFYHGYGAQKAQYIIRASELTAAGVTPGYINSVRFEVTSLGTTVLNGFNIALGTTAQTTATANTAITGLTSVYTKEAQTLVSGMNTFTFNTSFMWDGVNNLVVEVVFSNNNTGGSSTTVRTHTAAFTGTLAIYADNATAGAMLAATSSSTSLGTARSNTTTTTRPDMYFNTLGSCESARVAVVATVTAPPALALSSTTEAICAGASTTINVVDSSEEYTSYVWTPSTGVSGSVGSGFTFNPSITTTYELMATTGTGCVDSVSVVVTVNPLPSVVVTDPVQTMCSVGSPVALTASMTNATAKVGNGTLVNTNTGLPAPISLYWGGAKHQMLILASELQALGFRAGDQINSIGFVVNNVGASFAGTLNSLSVSMGHTSAAALTTTYLTGLTTVRTASNFTMPTSGYPNNVTIPLTSNFTWNGTGNLVVQTSFSNSITGNESLAVNTQYSSMSFNSTTYNRSDGATPVAILNASSGTVIANRPNILLGKVDTNVYTWSPVEGLYTNAAGTIAYTGGAAATVYAKPSVNTVYAATATSAVGCDSVVTATVNVTPATVWYQDADNDGFGNEAVTMMACSKPEGYVAIAGDCNDTVATIYPGAPEVCYDGIVQNCGTDGKGGCPSILTTLHANSCGKLLTSVNSPAYSANPTLPVGTSITGYRFEVTNLNSGAVREVERSTNYFTMSMTDIFEYATTYSVRVAVRVNQEWQLYGSSCTVTTLSIPTTSIVNATCGSELSNIASQINSTPIQNVTMYEFRVVNTSNPSQVQTLQRVSYNFNLTMLTEYPVEYNTTYQISVRVSSMIDEQLVWSSYGAACNVTTPVAPTTQIQLSQCEMVATGWAQNIAANQISVATDYMFIFKNASLGYEQSIERTSRLFTLNMFTGLQSGTTYDVTVRVKTYGIWSPEGKVCTITTPGVAPVSSREEVVYKVVEPTTDFSIVGYPNPFSTSFGIELRSTSTENLSLSIYDMTGRLLEVREVTVNQIPELQLGDRYPSGVYNVVASQGATLRTIRVVKR